MTDGKRSPTGVLICFVGLLPVAVALFLFLVPAAPCPECADAIEDYPTVPPFKLAKYCQTCIRDGKTTMFRAWRYRHRH